MAIGGRHVVVVALVTLLLTFAAFQVESVSVAGRKGLAEPQNEAAPAVFADESTTTSQDTSEQQTSSEEVSTEEYTTEEPSSEEFATEESTAVDESFNAEDLQAQENVEFSTDASEETSFERTRMREMEEVMAPPADNSAAAGPSTTIENPDASNYPEPKYSSDYFLKDIARENAIAKRNERAIQSCIQDEGCGTPQN